MQPGHKGLNYPDKQSRTLDPAQRKGKGFEIFAIAMELQKTPVLGVCRDVKVPIFQVKGEDCRHRSREEVTQIPNIVIADRKVLTVLVQRVEINNHSVFAGLAFGHEKRTNTM